MGLKPVFQLDLKPVLVSRFWSFNSKEEKPSVLDTKFVKTCNSAENLLSLSEYTQAWCVFG